MQNENQIRLALFFVRAGIALVLFMWTLDKLINPEHAAAVYSNFYFIEGISASIFYVIGGLELILITFFILGIKKRISYLVVFVIHGISTLSSYNQYLNPFEGPALLFFAAIPMLAACYLLYLMRDSDSLYSFNIS